MTRLLTDRQDIVRILAEVFRQYGFEGASMSRITEATKLGKGSLYHYFPGGKDEMAQSVLIHIRSWFEEQIFQPLERLPPDKAINHMFSGIDDYFRSGQRICLVGAIALEQTRDRFAEAVNGYFHRWLTSLSSALCNLGLREREAMPLAIRVIASVQGGLVLARAMKDESYFLAVLNDLRQSILLARSKE